MKLHPFISLLRLLPAIVAAAALCSCMSRVPYTPGAVMTAAISAFAVPPTMTFETKGSSVDRSLGNSMANSLGVVGAIAGSSLEQRGHRASQQTDEAMRQFYAQEVRRILTEEIAARGQFKVVSDGQADGIIEVQCGEWGLRYIDGGVWTGKMAAMATLNCKMTDRSGRVLWDDNNYHMHQGKAFRALDGEESWRITWFGYTKTPRTREELAASPDLIRRELSASIRHRARQIASGLPQGANARAP